MSTHLCLAGEPQPPDLTQLLGHISTALQGITDALACAQQLVASPPVDIAPAGDEPPLKAAEAAAQLSVPYRTLMRLIHSGEIGHVKPGREYLIPREEIRRYLSKGRVA